MRLRLLLAPALLVLAVAPATAQAATLKRGELHAVCRVNPRTLPALHSMADVQALCSRRDASAASIVYGSCGSSWIYDQKLGRGWITEYFGVRSNGLWGALRYGGALIHWYNFSHRQYRGAELDPIYGGWVYDGVKHADTHTGLIGSWYDAAVVTTRGYVCTNYYFQPFDFVRV